MERFEDDLGETEVPSLGCSCRSLKKGTDFRADGGGLCRDGRGWGGMMLGFRPGCPVDSGAVHAEAGVGAEGSGHCDLS